MALLADPESPPVWNWLAALAETGWAVALDVVPPALAADLAAEAAALHAADRLILAGVGRAEDFTLARAIRRDKTRWLARESAAQAAYLGVMETVRLALNRSLFLGLFSYEAHYAVYEPGGFYARHLDAFKGARNRVVSTVFYLNEDWAGQDGGELAVFSHDEAREPVTLIAPELGTLAIFLSEDIPHEVRPALRERYSIAGWFRVNDRAMAPSLQAPPV
jgi:SM-20-related protein